MVDIVVDNNVHIDFLRRCFSRYVVGINQDVHYAFALEGVTTDLMYAKSIDGGATWSTPTLIHVGTIVKFQVWYERWTPNDSGALIHIILLDTTPDSLSYYSLDTTDDTLSSEVEIDTPVISGNVYNNNQVTIAKACGGNLLVQYWGDNAGSHGCWRSVDGGLTWIARTDAADGNEPDFVMMFPGNETDNQDMWLIYWDISANELFLKVYDDSNDSWSQALIVTNVIGSAGIWQYAGAIRHSDRHLLVAIWTQLDNPNADLLTFDINGGASIVPMADVVTDQDEAGNACLTINQQNDNVFVGYNRGGAFQSTVDSVYKASTDGMASWGFEKPMSENASDDYRALSSTLSIGDEGGKFLPVWFNHDLEELLCNVNNAVSVDIAPVLPQYGQLRSAVGQPPVFGATIVRS